MSTRDPRMIFGVLVKDVDQSEMQDVSEEVIEALEDAGVKDSEWEWIVWLNRSSLMIVVHGGLRVKAVLAREDWLSVVSPQTVIEKMDKQKNDWVAPKSSKRRGGAYEQALVLLTGWQESQFADVEPEDEIIAAPEMTKSTFRRRGTAIPKTGGVKKDKKTAKPEKAQETPEPEKPRAAEKSGKKDKVSERPKQRIVHRSERRAQVETTKADARDEVLAQFAAAMNGSKDTEGNDFSVSTLK